MNLSKNICYKVYVPVNYEKKDVGIATRISESMKREIDRLADEHDRTPAYIIRELLTRGLALYQADGRLKDENKPERRLAPVLATITPAIDPKADVRRMINDEDLAEAARRTTPRKTQRMGILKQKAK